MISYFPAQPLVLEANNDIQTLSNYYSWATFINDGGVSGTIDFGSGNVVTLKAGVSLTMPYLGRPYGETEVNGTGTIIRIIYVR